MGRLSPESVPKILGCANDVSRGRSRRLHRVLYAMQI